MSVTTAYNAMRNHARLSLTPHGCAARSCTAGDCRRLRGCSRLRRRARGTGGGFARGARGAVAARVVHGGAQRGQPRALGGGGKHGRLSKHGRELGLGPGVQRALPLPVGRLDDAQRVGGAQPSPVKRERVLAFALGDLQPLVVGVRG